MESKQTPETKTVEEIIGGYNCFCLKGEDGNIIDVYDSESVKEMLRAYADQEKRKEVSAFLLWLDLSDWVFMAGTNEFEHVLTGEIKPYDFVYDLYLLSLTQLNKEP